jgi:uncharacterized protein YjbJ (UPF0337 family)
MQGQAREVWGKLIADDLKQAGGKGDQLITLLRQKYGYTREQAEQESVCRLEEAMAY